MYDEVYGHSEVKVLSVESASIPITLPNKNKTISDYNVLMKIAGEVSKCIVIENIPVLSTPFVISSKLIEKIRGNFIISFTLEDKVTAIKTVDQTRLVVTE